MRYSPVIRGGKMTKDSYRRAFTEAQTELATTIAERDERNARIAQLKQTIRVLGDLLEEDPDQIEQLVSADEGGKPSGITSAARSAFIFGKADNYPLALTVANLKDLMIDRGFDFSGQANALASLTTVVRRLKESGEVEELTSSDGKRAYVWKGEVPKSLGRFRMHGDKIVGRVEEK
jgi:hypothetical protein